MIALFLFIQTRIGPGEDGQSLVEYALILSLIAVVAIPSLVLMEGGVGGLYDQVKTVADAIAHSLGAS